MKRKKKVTGKWQRQVQRTLLKRNLRRDRPKKEGTV
jgi:hypothetical protein